MSSNPYKSPEERRQQPTFTIDRVLAVFGFLSLSCLLLIVALVAVSFVMGWLG